MINFTKMTGTGNDFIMIDNRKNIVKNRSVFAKEYCRQHYSIGADGVIFIEAPHSACLADRRVPRTLHDFRMRIFNPDGSEAEMCGNGARCAVMFSYLKGIVKKRTTSFLTKAGVIQASISKENIKLKMVEPVDVMLNKKIKIKNSYLTVHHIDTGVPHTIVIVKDAEKVDIDNYSPQIRYNKVFRKGTNVDYVQILNGHSIKMRTYERGIEGETLACGTGATASAIILSLLGYTRSPVDVIVKGGKLKIYFELNESSCCGTCKVCHGISNVFLEGEAKVVYEGVIK